MKVEADTVYSMNDTVLCIELGNQIGDFEYFLRFAHVSRVLLGLAGRLNAWDGRMRT